MDSEDQGSNSGMDMFVVGNSLDFAEILSHLYVFLSFFSAK